MKSIRYAVTLALLGAGAPAAGAAQSPATPLVFDDVTVVDVDAGTLLADRRVVVVGNHIAAIGHRDAVKRPRSARVVDARGKYLIPGLWDMHTHLYKNDNRYATLFAYQLLLANGVTGFRDAGTMVPLDTLVQWRREILAGTRVGAPRQLFSGHLISGPTTPCRRLSGEDHVCIVDTADARVLVDSLKAAGADMIKTYDLSPAGYFAVAAAARRAGLLFGGHAPSVSPLAAADSGASILDHIGEEHVGAMEAACFDPVKATLAACQPIADRFRRTNTWSVPTLINRASYLPGSSPPAIPGLLRQAVHRFWAHATFSPGWLHDPEPLVSPDSLGFGSLRVAMRVGLPIAAGGDTPPSEAGFKLHAELAMLVARGLTPLAALQAATLNPAKLLRATDSMGTVAVGKLADLVLLDANPLEDITHTTMIRAVVANGRYFDRAALDRMLATIAQTRPWKDVQGRFEPVWVFYDSGVLPSSPSSSPSP